MNTTNKSPELDKYPNIALQEKSFAKLIEITYVYPPLESDPETKYKFNDTIFFALLGEEVNWKYMSVAEAQRRMSDNYLRVESFLNDKIAEYEEDIAQIWDRTDDRSLLDKWALEYNIHILNFTLLGLPFELEKAGIENGYVKSEKIWILEEQKTHEAAAWMPQISESPKYANVCYKFLCDTLRDSDLSEEDKEKFKPYLSKLESDAWDEFSYSEKSWEASETKKFINMLKGIKVPRTQVIQMFEWAMQINWINKKVIEADVDFIYDWPDALYYPKKKAFDYRTMDRVLALIDHEIEKHFFNERVHEEIHGEWAHRFAWNLPKEEGLAIAWEKILLWEDLSDIPVQYTFIMTYFWEMLPWDEFLQFLYDLSTVVPQADVLGRFYRMKRWKDLDLPWVQEKDGLYSIWVMEIVDFIENGWQITDLFLWKHSLADLDRVKALRGEEKTEIPIGISEILMYNLMGKYWYQVAESFDVYISDKYGEHDSIWRKPNRSQARIAKQMRDTLMGIIDDQIPTEPES